MYVRSMYYFHLKGTWYSLVMLINLYIKEKYFILTLPPYFCINTSI